MTLQFEPAWIGVFGAPLLVGLLAVVIGLRIRSRRRDAATSALVGLAIAVSLWSLFDLGRRLVVDADLTLLLLVGKYAVLPLVLGMWVLVGLEAAGADQYRVPAVVVVSVVALLVTVVVATNPIHQLFFSNVQLISETGYVATVFDFGPLYWLHMLYANACLLAGSGLLVYGAARRGVVAALVAAVAACLPLLATAIFVLGIAPYDLTPLGFAVATLLLCVPLRTTDTTREDTL